MLCTDVYVQVIVISILVGFTLISITFVLLIFDNAIQILSPGDVALYVSEKRPRCWTRNREDAIPYDDSPFALVQYLNLQVIGIGIVSDVVLG